MRKLKTQNIEVVPKWKEFEDGYNSVNRIYLGKLHVVGYFYDGIATDKSKRFKIISPLPTLRNITENYKTKEDAINACEKVLNVFLQQLNDCT